MRKNISIVAAAGLLALGATAALAQPAPDVAANRIGQFVSVAPAHSGAWAYYVNQPTSGADSNATVSDGVVQSAVPHEHR